MIVDHSSMPPHLTDDEEFELIEAKAEYEDLGNRRYLAVLAEMRARSKERIIDQYRRGEASRHETVDAVYANSLENA